MSQPGAYCPIRESVAFQSTAGSGLSQGFEDEVGSFSLFAYLSRSPVTWNPSVVSVCRDSLYCPTMEEYILPIIHGNDRAEWFVQLSDEIIWTSRTGTPAARAIPLNDPCSWSGRTRA